jgi:hypothetical protein
MPDIFGQSNGWLVEELPFRLYANFGLGSNAKT